MNNEKREFKSFKNIVCVCQGHLFNQILILPYARGFDFIYIVLFACKLY